MLSSEYDTAIANMILQLPALANRGRMGRSLEGLPLPTELLAIDGFWGRDSCCFQLSTKCRR